AVLTASTTSSSRSVMFRFVTAIRIPTRGRLPWAVSVGRFRGEPPQVIQGNVVARLSLIEFISIAQSATVRAMGPTWSRVGDNGMIPVVGIRLKQGLKAETPQRDAGIRIDPAVSVPRAVGTTPVATAAADPPLEPPAERSGAQGFPTWSVEPPAANSCV